jgi:NAD(P)H-dependent flavin oxidoreductase YrpB (nitropropane dioxygenase family)
MQDNGCSKQEITEMYHSGYRKGMLEGDIEDGTLVCGAVCGIVQRVESAATVMQEVVRQAEGIMGRM